MAMQCIAAYLLLNCNAWHSKDDDDGDGGDNLDDDDKHDHDRDDVEDNDRQNGNNQYQLGPCSSERQQLDVCCQSLPFPSWLLLACLCPTPLLCLIPKK